MTPEPEPVDYIAPPVHHAVPPGFQSQETPTPAPPGDSFHNETFGMAYTASPRDDSGLPPHLVHKTDSMFRTLDHEIQGIGLPSRPSHSACTLPGRGNSRAGGFGRGGHPRSSPIGGEHQHQQPHASNQHYLNGPTQSDPHGLRPSRADISGISQS